MNSTSTIEGPTRSTWKKTLHSVVFSKKWLIIPPIAFGVIFMGYMVNTKKELPRTEVPEQAVSVPVIEVIAEDIETSVVGFGTANPSRTWTAISEVGGRIESVHPDLESGNPIRAGEVLVTIDPKDYELRLAQREADLDAAKASLAELYANQRADEKSLAIEKDILEVSRKDLERNRRLQKQSAISVAEFDQSQNNLLRQNQSVQKLENSLTLYPSRIASAKAKIAMAESARNEAERNLHRTTIKSEIGGVLSGVNLEVGQIVGANQQLFQVNDNRHVEIETQITLAQLKQLKVSIASDALLVAPDQSSNWLRQLRAVVTSESGSRTFVWKGTPVRLTDSLDSQTRTIGIVVQIDNESKLNSTNPSDTVVEFNQIPLTAGTYCEVKLFAEPLNSVVALPRTAFDEEQVYLVDADNRLVIRDVVRGDHIGDRVIIQSGVVEGDRVIVRPPIPAIEGMLVRPQ